MIKKKHTKKILILGGGSGVRSVIEGLSKYEDVHLTCVHTVSDNGQSQGELVETYKIPSGMSDERNYIIAMLSKESPWRNVLNYRYTEGNLLGHNVGTLLIGSLFIQEKNPIRRNELLKKMFGIRHDIFPVSDKYTKLYAEMKDGSIVRGEHEIDLYESGEKDGRIKRVWLENRKILRPALPAGRKAQDDKLNNAPKILPIVHERILQADLIVFGPGDVYTTLSALLSVDGVCEVLQETEVPIVFTLPLEKRQGMSYEDILKYFSKFVKFDHVIDPVKEELLMDENSVEIHGDRLKRSLLRTDPKKHAEAILRYIKKYHGS